MIYTKTGRPQLNLLSILVSKDKLRGAAFISIELAGELNPTGTAFFVKVPWGVHRSICYAVTARHCVDGYDEIYLEYSDRDGGYRQIQTHGHEWIKSDDTDLAVFQLRDGSNVQAINIDHHFITPYSFTHGLIPGYEVFIVGLFVKSPYRLAAGELQGIQPIARFGRLSLEDATANVFLSMEDQRNNKSTAIHARLIESLAFAGESGSPVFIYEEHSVERRPLWYGEDEVYGMLPKPPHRSVVSDEDIPTPLLGLISSHWQIDENVKISRFPTSRSFSKQDVISGSVQLNPGIAVVVPGEAIKEFIMNDQRLMAARESIVKRSGSAPTTPLSAEPPDFTRDDFESALKKVSKRIQPSQSDEGK